MTGTATLGVGILGSGPVTQAIHLPALARLTDLFTVRAVMDVSEATAAEVAARVSARATTSVDDLLRDNTVDVVAESSRPVPRRTGHRRLPGGKTSRAVRETVRDNHR